MVKWGIDAKYSAPILGANCLLDWLSTGLAGGWLGTCWKTERRTGYLEY